MSIARKAIIDRHAVRLTRPDPLTPLSVGNGEFAFTADITGLQTFPQFHTGGIALGAQAQWAWHSFPNPEGFHLGEATTLYDTGRGRAPFADNAAGDERKTAANAWLRANPHRLGLGRAGFVLRGEGNREASLRMDELTQTRQTLDLWRGVLGSAFCFQGNPVHVLTVCHPTRDQIAVRIESPLLADCRLAVSLAFAYPAGDWAAVDDWERPERHETEFQQEARRCRIARLLDADRYYADLAWSDGGALEIRAPHQCVLTAPGRDTLEFVLAFSPRPNADDAPDFTATLAVSEAHWERFWTRGGAVDLGGCTDSRAPELERRIVLSQYLTAIHCAGSMPPQETGLVTNSWYGKSHLEMHWWHAAHFALWGRAELLERSLPWYESILPRAQETARAQGFRGARWPKMVAFDGRESPSPVGVFLIWQQPHPIYCAELCRRARPGRETLARWREIVFETAAFMASYPLDDGERSILGPPLIPAQESYSAERAGLRNPTFELAYWWWGLETAQRWRERLGLPRDPDWERVKDRLARPTVRGGVYAAIETPPYTRRIDHPSMLGALGFVPPTPLVGPRAMRRTLESVCADWDWPTTWGWDYPLAAMCAARLGLPSLALDLLLRETPKNRYLANGHNYQRPSLPLYLPGNGGLLAAVAMMAAGWDGAPTHDAPGFPADGGKWPIRWEGLAPMP